MAQGPDAFGERRRGVTLDVELGQLSPGTLGRTRCRLPREGESAKSRQDFDVEQVRRGDVTPQRFPQLRLGRGSDERFDGR